jgi:ketosteroid isomerase-like protein
MKTNGSLYVAAVFAVLAGYFTYMWWFNPQRAIKGELSALAAALSVPAESAGHTTGIERAAELRHFFADDVHVSAEPGGREITSRDALLAAVAAWIPPPGGCNVDFVDVQVALDADAALARAYMTVEMTTADQRTGQPAMDKKEMVVSLAKAGGAWVIANVRPAEAPPAPGT